MDKIERIRYNGNTNKNSKYKLEEPKIYGSFSQIRNIKNKVAKQIRIRYNLKKRKGIAIKMKITLQRGIWFVLIIINCIAIFQFSNQNAQISGNTSGKVVDWIADIIPSIKTLDEEEKTRVKEEIMQPIIRKLAHFSIYALLGFLIMGLTCTYKGTFYQKVLFSVLLSCCYAISDEIHQLFISGRSGQITDVFIDTAGALTGAIILMLIIKCYRRITKKQRERQKLEKDTKILFISSTGGHFNELMQLKPLFTKCTYHIVTETSPAMEHLKQEYGKKLDFLAYGTKKTPLRYIGILFINCFKSLWIYLEFRPQIVITTGTHTAGPMCCIAKILGSKVIYIETFANRNTKTQAGRLLYYIADVFIVQWEEMLSIYPKAIYLGGVY